MIMPVTQRPRRRPGSALLLQHILSTCLRRLQVMVRACLNVYIYVKLRIYFSIANDVVAITTNDFHWQPNFETTVGPTYNVQTSGLCNSPQLIIFFKKTT